MQCCSHVWKAELVIDIIVVSKIVVCLEFDADGIGSGSFSSKNLLTSRLVSDSRRGVLEEMV